MGERAKQTVWIRKKSLVRDSMCSLELQTIVYKTDQQSHVSISSGKWKKNVIPTAVSFS